MKLRFEVEVGEEVQFNEDELNDLEEEVEEVVLNRIDSIMKGRE